MEPFVNFQIITEEISIINNYLADGEFSVCPEIKREYGTIDGENNLYFTRLILKLVNKEEAAFPIDLKIVLMGQFSMEKVDTSDINNFLKYQAVQILFPYMRTMVSNITSSAMMTPIVLPIIDVLKLFPEDE